MNNILFQMIAPSLKLIFKPVLGRIYIAWASDVTLRGSWVTPEICLEPYVNPRPKSPLTSHQFPLDIYSQVLRTYVVSKQVQLQNITTDQ